MIQAAVRLNNGKKHLLEIKDDGFTQQELIDAIKEQFPEAKTILLSGMQTKETAEEQVA